MLTKRALQRSAQREYERREREQRESGARRFDSQEYAHPAQLRYVKARTKRNVARTPRRVGKTTGIGLRLLDGVFEAPFANQLYVTGTLKLAKRRVWPTLKKLNRRLRLGGEVNDTEGFMRFPSLPNEPHVFLGGAKDQVEIDKIAGYEGGFKRVVVDEAQEIRASMMERLLDDVVEPTLFDYDGELDVVGTPGAVPAGYFHDIDVGDKREAWTHFFWSMADNPFLPEKSGKTVEELLAAIRARHSWDEKNPTYRRQYLGEWVTDSDALALHYDRARNACAWQDAPEPGWRYVICFDIGFEDADAIAVLGWAPFDRRLRLVKEVITRKQGITELGNQLRLLWNIFRPIHLVGDLGALGKKIGEELRVRWQLPVEAADKNRKAEHVGLLDDGLLTGAFLAPPDSVFAEDCAIVQWDAEAKAKSLLKLDASYHSDVIDAVLYGYRLAYHWIEPEAPPEPNIFDSPILKALLADPKADRPNYT